MNYKNLDDGDLQNTLVSAVKKERQLMAQILEMLLEVEKRRLYALRGYPSMHAYCTEFLGYSDGAAHRRISSMRLMMEMPHVKQKLEKGALHLSNLSKAASFFRQEEKLSQSPYPTEKKVEVLKSLEGKSQKQAERHLVNLNPKAFSEKVCERPLSEDITEIRFTIDAKTLKQLDRLKELKPQMNTKELFMWMLKRNLKQIDPLKRPEKKLDKKSNPSVRTQNSNQPIDPRKTPQRKHLPKATRQKVWQNAHGVCQFKDHLSKKRCQSRAGLEVDHIQPLSLGGSDAPQNLRLLCREHHKLMTRNTFADFSLPRSLPQRK